MTSTLSITFLTFINEHIIDVLLAAGKVTINGKVQTQATLQALLGTEADDVPTSKATQSKDKASKASSKTKDESDDESGTASDDEEASDAEDAVVNYREMSATAIRQTDGYKALDADEVKKRFGKPKSGLNKEQLVDILSGAAEKSEEADDEDASDDDDEADADDADAEEEDPIEAVMTKLDAKKLKKATSKLSGGKYVNVDTMRAVGKDTKNEKKLAFDDKLKIAMPKLANEKQQKELLSKIKKLMA